MMADLSAIDNLLAEAGYTIPESQLPRLAEQIENLESLLEGNEIPELLSEMFHFDPSDVVKWTDRVLTEVTNTTHTEENESIHSPGNIEETQSFSEPVKERYTYQVSVPCVINLALEEQAGLMLIQLLFQCATCIEQVPDPRALLNQVRELASVAGIIGQVAIHFQQGLSRRIYQSENSTEDPAFLERLYYEFYKTCPYLKFGHFTANQAMLEELEDHPALHIIDFNLSFGLQWPPLIHMLAMRNGGPPHLRLTAIASTTNMKLQIQHRGMKLVRMASELHVHVQFCTVNDLSEVELRTGEAVAVNSVCHLHTLLNDEDNFNRVLGILRRTPAKIFTVVEQDSNHNLESFADRFTEALHYYSSMFDSIHTRCSHMSETAAEAYLGQEICNIIACEGKARIERHERLDQWRQRMLNMGFKPRQLGSDAFNQAATLLGRFPGGHTLQESSGCLILKWQTRPLFAASAWHCY